MLTKNQIKDITNAKMVTLTSVDKDGWPRSIYVIPSRVTENEIIISNIQMQKTIKNIKATGKCFINVYIPEKDDLQYKIDVEKAQIQNSGDLFNEIKQFEETYNLPPELKVHEIIIFKIKNVEMANG